MRLTPITDKQTENNIDILIDDIRNARRNGEIDDAIFTKFLNINNSYFPNGQLTYEGYQALQLFYEKYVSDSIPQSSDDNLFTDDDDIEREEQESQQDSAKWSDREIQILSTLLPNATNIYQLQKELPNKSIQQIRRKIYNLKLKKHFKGSGRKEQVRQKGDNRLTIEDLMERGVDISSYDDLTQNLVMTYTTYLEKITKKEIKYT